MIDTGKVQDRRKLRYQSIDELLADMDRIAAADKAGKLRCTGNWTAGQAMGHLAAWINYSYEGYQPTVKSFNEETAVKDGFLPESLTYTIVTPEMVPMGLYELELEPAINQLYQQIYQEVTGGA